MGLGNARDAPASEGIGALEIQLGAFLHEPLAIAPLVNSVFEMGIQNFHGCGGVVTRGCAHQGRTYHP